MLNAETIAELSTYKLPADAGPAWRAAYEAGEDMSLVECNLAMTPDQRIREHQAALDLALAIQAASPWYEPE